MDITVPELKELVVHHVYKVSKDELIKSSLTPQGIVRPLFWSDGVLFSYYSLPLEANGVSEDYLKGKEHWAEAFWTEMPAYSEMIELEDEHLKGVKVRVIDMSTFTPQKEFAKWVKGKGKK